MIDAPGAAFALIEDLTELPEVLDLREGAEVLCVVVSEDGQTPHADMVVRLKQWEMWIEGEGWLQEAVTDASGVARFTRVAPGRWSVDVVGHCATEFVQLAPDDRMARVTVAVPEGNTVLAGRVALEKHRFFGGCVVVEGGEWTGFRAMRAPVELDGSFEVSLPTRKTNSWRIGFTTPWSGTILWSAMRYPSELFAEVHFPKQPATVRISVVDPSGRPVERYGVRAYARNGADDPRDRNIRHPGRDRVRFMGLHRDGRLEINDMVVGPQDHIMIQAVPADGDLARSRTVEIHARNEVDARITVPWAVPLTVRVTDREGTRIADAVVEVVAPPPKDPGWRWEMLPENDYLLPEELTEPAIVARGRTDATGTTRLALPQGGTYAVRARQDAWGVVADAGVHVPLTGAWHQFVLEPPGRLVVHAGWAVASDGRVRFELERDGTSWPVRARAVGEGACAFDGLVPGRWVVRARVDGELDGTFGREVDVWGGETAHVHVDPDAWRMTEVRMRVEAGESVEGGTLHMHRTVEGLGTRRGSYPWRKGQVITGTAIPGNYRAVLFEKRPEGASGPDRRAWYSRNTLVVETECPVSEHVWRLDRRVVRLAVVDGGGRPIERADVHVSTASGHGTCFGRTDAAGLLWIADGPDEPFSINIEGHGRAVDIPPQWQSDPVRTVTVE